MRPTALKAFVLTATILAFTFKLANCQEVSNRVCFRDICVDCEIADSDEKRIKGLMFREDLAQNSGMLFIFPFEDKYSFWMKNMRFSLDMIWIGSDRKIVDINKNVLPCGASCEEIIPKAKAKYVLEVNSGFADKNRIKIGQDAEFK